MDPDPEPYLSLFTIDSFHQGHILALVFLSFLILISALISGAEVAFFSWKPDSVEAKPNSKLVQLLDNPKKLLATILVSNNFVNIGIVILAAYITETIFDFSNNQIGGLLLQLFGITFILLLFGEVLPKIYASRHPDTFVSFVLVGIYYLYILMLPLSKLLARSTRIFKDKARQQPLSVDDLSQALELAGGNQTGDRNQMLVDIVKFGNTTVKQIMTPRVDMTYLELEQDYGEVLTEIRASGYSRLPVCRESLDEIEGVLYTKDMLPHTEEPTSFQWQKLIRPAFFVPESKKIDDLLHEFRMKKVHMAIVVDEFGGTSGLVSLEDIIEEIVGEITDEFDLEDSIYSRIDDNTFVFEGKTPLHEFLRILHIQNTEPFDDAKGDSDTLAGFIIEISGELPKINQQYDFAHMTFSIEAMENRRIKRVKVHLHEIEDE
ncbi:MAG: gliding motility-associated protein GldE [Cryomorphaceae bacterium]|nr:gliding motility-associated protein GldE [Cryomorphaceae bacterium]